MFQELDNQDYKKVENLFTGIPYGVSLRALLAHINPGHVFVDDLKKPRTAFALTVDGYYLAGEYADPLTRQELSFFLRDQIFTAEIFTGTDFWMMLAVHPVEWEQYLPEIIPTHEPEKVHRYQYCCDHLAFDWRGTLPDDFRMIPVSDILSGAVKVDIPEDLQGEVSLASLWGSVEGYIRQGMGMAVIHNGQAVTICRAVCATQDILEIGIDTLPSYRHRGLAAAATAATVEQGLQHGYRQISWQCDFDNTGSWKTAERVGFIRCNEYDFFDYIFDAGDQLAQLGYRAYLNKEFQKCIDYYLRAFRIQVEKQASDRYLLAVAYASLGDSDNTIKYLHEAAGIGWHSVERTEKTPAFQVLHGTKEWEDILQEIRGKG
jgi:GNAT superfamily N-acetyltransferase